MISLKNKIDFEMAQKLNRFVNDHTSSYLVDKVWDCVDLVVDLRIYATVYENACNVLYHMNRKNV